METILQRLTDLDDVLGAVLVGKDGLIVTGTLHSEDEEVIGAMSAAAFGSSGNGCQVRSSLPVATSTQRTPPKLASMSVLPPSAKTIVCACATLAGPAGG